MVLGRNAAVANQDTKDTNSGGQHTYPESWMREQRPPVKSFFSMTVTRYPAFANRAAVATPPTPAPVRPWLVYCYLDACIPRSPMIIAVWSRSTPMARERRREESRESRHALGLLKRTSVYCVDPMRNRRERRQATRDARPLRPPSRSARRFPR
jgi:hypothetical protein